MTLKTKSILHSTAPLAIGLFFAFGFLPARAAPVENQSELILGKGSHLWLKGDSTLHPYSSTATVITADVSMDHAKINAFDVTIPVEGLKSGEKGLDKNMYKALKAAENPHIEFHFLPGQLISEGSKGTVFPIKGEGNLSIAGKENKVTIEAEANFTETGLHLRGTKTLLMTDYGVKPPVMMGVIRVRNEVTIGFDLTLEPKVNGAKAVAPQ